MCYNYPFAQRKSTYRDFVGCDTGSEKDWTGWSTVKLSDPKPMEDKNMESSYSEKTGNKVAYQVVRNMDDLEKMKWNRGNPTVGTVEEKPPADMVNHPPHYETRGIQCIDWIAALLYGKEFKGYLKGNVLKYLWRHENKGNPVQDLKKARWYLDELIDEFECEDADGSDKAVAL